ncbi:MAG: DMT family transporter [Geminicoccaceae bacterium]|nr:DMT family transporter [Geminicoccaceae bacterium]
MGSLPLGTGKALARPDLVGIGAAVLGAALFGTKPVFIKLAYADGTGALTLLFWRMAFALPAYLVIGGLELHKRRRGGGLPGQRIVLLAALNGLLGYYVASLLDFTGLEHVTAQLERLILFTYPFWVVILGTLFFGQKLRAVTFPAFAVAYAGLGLIFWRAMGTTRGADLVAGSILVLGAAFAFALAQLFGRGLIVRIGAGLYTSIAMTAAGLGVVAHVLLAQPFADLAVSGHVLALAFCLAVVSTILPSYIQNFALGRIGADGAAMAGNAGPVFTILLGVWLLAEPFGPFEALGTLLVIGGVALFTRR